MGLHRLGRKSANLAALASWWFESIPVGEGYYPTHETSRSSSNGKDAMVEENVSSGILEKPLRCSSTKEGAMREML